MSNELARGHVWAVILAAGDGNRLRSLTTTRDGISVPKQYCSLLDGASLLENALQRAEAVADKNRICTVVAAQHRRWWEPSLSTFSADRIVVQPKNCGTAIGIMLPLLHILQRDPLAYVVLLPSDHYVREERVLARSLAQAAQRIQTDARKIVMLGIEPDEADAELGYVLPAKHLGDRAFTVAQFVEKPPLNRARELLAEGALWNTFILAGSAQTLVDQFGQRCPGILEDMQTIIGGEYEEPLRSALLNELYQRLPTLDFSRDVLQDAADLLEVLSVPMCGWTDLGTPQRVAEVLQRSKLRKGPARPSGSIPVSLAAQAGFLSVARAVSQEHMSVG